ncbi:MAG: site-specific integrase [Acidimicrobiaceae bacterium]|nr:site-specific integrase [Acidimicrobiaceae bacterium]
MSGSLRQIRPGVWEMRVRTGRDPLTGQYRQISRTFRGLKKDAQVALNELAVEADQGNLGNTNATFGQLAERWLDLAKPDLGPQTFRSYRGLLDNHILPALGTRPLRHIQTADLDSMYHSLVKRKGLSTSSVRRVHTVIHRAFRQGVRWKWVRANPATLVNLPKLSRYEVTPPDVKQVRRLMAAATKFDPVFGRLLHVAATTGARRGELCALKWKQVDTSSSALLIEHAIIETPGGGWQEKDTKTHASRRIALDSETLRVLAEQRVYADELARAAELTLMDESYVFSLEPDGQRPLLPTYVTRRFERVRGNIGLTQIRFHDFRHFAATRLISSGVSVRTVAGRLGHSNASMTLQVYSHFVEAADQEAADLIGSLVSNASTNQKTKPRERKKNPSTA